MTARETILGLSTLAVVLFGSTYLLGDVKLKEWRTLGDARESVNQEIVRSERLIEQRPIWEAKLEKNLTPLPTYPEGQEAVPQLLKAVERMATDTGLKFTSRVPEREKSVGEVYELTIKCNWQGELEAVVRFLYALQTKGVMYDVRSLQAQPTGKTGGLKGSVSVDCAYVRGADEPEVGLRVEPVPAKEETNAAP